MNVLLCCNDNSLKLSRISYSKCPGMNYGKPLWYNWGTVLLSQNKPLNYNECFTLPFLCLMQWHFMFSKMDSLCKPPKKHSILLVCPVNTGSLNSGLYILFQWKVSCRQISWRFSETIILRVKRFQSRIHFTQLSSRTHRRLLHCYLFRMITRAKCVFWCCQSEFQKVGRTGSSPPERTQRQSCLHIQH